MRIYTSSSTWKQNNSSKSNKKEFDQRWAEIKEKFISDDKTWKYAFNPHSYRTKGNLVPWKLEFTTPVDPKIVLPTLSSNNLMSTGPESEYSANSDQTMSSISNAWVNL